MAGADAALSAFSHFVHLKKKKQTHGGLVYEPYIRQENVGTAIFTQDVSVRFTVSFYSCSQCEQSKGNKGLEKHSSSFLCVSL